MDELERLAAAARQAAGLADASGALAARTWLRMK